ncbi:MAG: hypothetical protein VR76_06455 [Pseudomonas sp. BRH_c35]|nr:MAG: hypothetical protein VR76_06455 [Pseudomonas sp. BRH_c35]
MGRPRQTCALRGSQKRPGTSKVKVYGEHLFTVKTIPHFNIFIWPLHSASAPMQGGFDSLFDAFAIQHKTPDVIQMPV